MGLIPVELVTRVYQRPLDMGFVKRGVVFGAGLAFLRSSLPANPRLLL